MYRDNIDSRGVKWIGEVAENLSIHAVKRHYDIQLGKMLQNAAESENDISVSYLKALHVLWGRVEIEDLPQMWASPSEIVQYGVKSGDLLVCEGGEVGRAGVVDSPPEDCIIQNALHRVRSKTGANVRYLHYVLHLVSSAGWFDVLCNKATIAHFTREKFADLQIPIPSNVGQIRIAAFLDRETARIDQLIAKKERQIELLQEKRSALISHAVTKGLNPKAKMKDSGIEWLGVIPEHWDVFRSKVVFEEINDRSDTGVEELLSVSHITGVTPRSEKEVNMFMAESMEGYKKCKRNDLVINTMWAWMGAMGIAFHDGIVSPSYNTYRFRSSAIEPRYYDFLFRTRQFISEVICCSKGVWQSRLRLYPDEFFGIRIPCPPSDEQRKIVIYIDQQTGYIVEMQRKIEKSIGMLREYRTSLISAAVTGNIDVREEVA